MTDTIALIVGIVVGVGIFKTPSLIAANTGGNGLFFLVWLLGGVVSLTGVLCYAELATTRMRVETTTISPVPSAGRWDSFLRGHA
jgi:amino acid transporter